jgi:uncharacterized membrane protein YidH (DUF202 family)
VASGEAWQARLRRALGPTDRRRGVGPGQFAGRLVFAVLASAIISQNLASRLDSDPAPLQVLGWTVLLTAIWGLAVAALARGAMGDREHGSADYPSGWQILLIVAISALVFFVVLAASLAGGFTYDAASGA